jgi:autotransporter-associated beta strand protein
LSAAAAALALTATPADAVVLFRDDFSQTDTTFNQLVQNNTSLSGSVIGSMVQTSPTYLVFGTAGAENGTASIIDCAGTFVNYNFNNSTEITNNFSFTVTLESFYPASGWGALVVFDDSTYQWPEAIRSGSGLGLFFTRTGGFAVYKNGTSIFEGTGAPTGTVDLSLEITNISGFGASESFDYKVLFNGTPYTSGTMAGINTSRNYVMVDSYNGSTIVGALEVKSSSGIAPRYYWDIDGATAGAGGPAPSGTWAGTNWNSAADGTGTGTVGWVAGGTAVFAAGSDASGAYTVTVDSTQEIGGLTFDDGTVTLSGGGALRMTSDTAVSVGPGLTATVATAITQDATARSLTKSGTGTLILSGANSYAGGTNVNAGTLGLGAGNVLPNASAVTVGGNALGVTATLDANGNNDTIASLTLGGATATSGAAVITGMGTLTLGGDVTYDNTNNPLGATISGKLDLGAASRTFTVNDSATAAADLTVSAGISGAGVGLVKEGAGALFLSGANTYTGTTTLTGGVVNAAVAEDAGVSGPFGAPATAAGSIIFNGGTLQYSAANTYDYSGRLTTSGDNPYKIDTNGQSVTFAAALGASGSSGLTKLGAGTLVLSVANAYTGATTIQAGSVTVSGSGTLGAGGDLTLGGGSLDLGDTSQTVGAVSVAVAAGGDTIGNGSLIGTSYAASNATGTAIISANLLANGSAGLVKSGAGSLVLTGTNTYTGMTTVNAGMLLFGKQASLNGGIATLTPANVTAESGAVLGIALGDSGDGYFDPAAINTILSQMGSSTASTGMKPGAQIGLDTTNVAGGTLTRSTPIVNLSGGNSIGLAKLGTGTLVLEGVNTYTGGTTITGGTLEIVGTGQLAGGTYSGAIAIGTGATFKYNSSADQTLQTGVISGGGSLIKDGAGMLTLSGANTYTGDTTILNGVLKLQGGAFKTAARNYSIATGAVLNLDGATNIATGTSTISGSGTLRITNGVWSNTAEGRFVALSLGSGGLIDVQAGATLSNGAWNGFVWGGNSAGLNVDGTLNMNDSDARADALTGAGTIVKTYLVRTQTLTVGVANGSGTFSGTISNAVNMIALTKTGTGTQTLSGANTYNGATAVSQGKLLLGEGGSMGATAVSVTGTATYGTSYESSGNNIAGGKSLALASGTKLDMRDNNTNTLKFTTTGVLSGASLYFDLGTTTADCDILALTGAATVTGTNTFYFDALGSLAAGTYTLITAASGLSTGGTFAIGTTLPEYTLTLDPQDAAVYLNVALNAIPGDTNGDKVVDAADFITLKKNFNRTDAVDAQNGNFTTGDTNVDWADLSILMNNMGPVVGAPSTAPEPCSAMLLVFGAAVLLRRRRA